MMKPLVYVASPYTKGDVEKNVNFQMKVFDDLVLSNIVTPIVPLWSHFQHKSFPLDYEVWMEYDFQLIIRCDGLVRLDAFCQESGYFQSESAGADREVSLANQMGIPVFYSLPDLYSWAIRKKFDGVTKR